WSQGGGRRRAGRRELRSGESVWGASSLASIHSAASEARVTTSSPNAERPGIGFLTTGLPAARYSYSLSGSARHLFSVSTYGIRQTSNRFTNDGSSDSCRRPSMCTFGSALSRDNSGDSAHSGPTTTKDQSG